MNCKKCGAPVQSSELFCGNCGAPIESNENKCEFCGETLEAGAVFCGSCGTPVTQQTHESEYSTADEYEPDHGFRPSPRRRGNNSSAMLKIILATCVAAVIVLGVLIGYMYNIKKNDVPSETEAYDENAITYAENDSPTNEPVQQNIIPAQNTYSQISDYSENSAYKLYTGDRYSILYPADFTVSLCDGNELMCTSADGLASVDCYVQLSGSGANSEYSRCVSDHSGSIDYNSVGSNYFAVRIKTGDKYFYRYSKFSGGYMYTFTFDFPASQFNAYDKIINDMYAYLVKQF